MSYTSYRTGEGYDEVRLDPSSNKENPQYHGKVGGVELPVFADYILIA